MKAIALTVCFWLGCAYASAQNVNTEAVTVITRYEVKDAYLHEFRYALRRYVKRAAAKRSNIMAEGYYEQESTSVLWVIERWTNEAALDRNRRRVKFKVVKVLSEWKLTQPAKVINVKDLEPLSRDEWRRKSGDDDKPITIMLFVDSKPGTENEFKAVYHTAMPQFRGEPGVINYQLSQVKSDNTQFVTYEKFRNEDAFQNHLKFPPILPVIDYLNTSIKEQPFQTGLHRLVMFAPVKQ